MLRPPSVDFVSNGGPVARAWAGPLQFTSSSDATTIVYGGLGAGDGVKNGAFDQDQRDMWFLDLAKLRAMAHGANVPLGAEWSYAGNSTCFDAQQLCTDSAVFADRFANVSAVVQALLGDCELRILVRVH